MDLEYEPKKGFSRLANRASSYYYAFLTLFSRKKSVDAINERNIKKALNKKSDLNFLVHGIGANYHRSMYSTIRLFEREGLEVISLDYNPRVSLKESSEYINNQIEKILEETKKKEFNLIGICYGGLVCRYYIEANHGYKNLNKFVTIFSPLPLMDNPQHSNFLGDFLFKIISGKERKDEAAEIKEIAGKYKVKEYLSLYSPDDKVMKTQFTIDPRLKQIRLRGGHTFVSYNKEAISLASDFILGRRMFSEKRTDKKKK